MKSCIKSLQTPSIHSSYQSAYRRNTPTITYDSYQFIQTICEVDSESGECRFIKGSLPITILIGQGWQKHIKGGKAQGAYISKGFTKFAFRVSNLSAHKSLPTDMKTMPKGRVQSEDLAIFQCQPARGYSEQLNSQDLRDELRLLGQAQYFLDTFYRRANSLGIKNLPGM